MATPPNRYGLTRNIPASVERTIRQRSKFGCVICRSAIYEYEHIEPGFVDCQTHDPDFMCLLCGLCHSKVTKNHLSKETVLREYKRISSDPNIKRPFGDIDVSANHFTIFMGNNKFTASKSIISIDDQDILRLDPPEDDGGPPLLSGVFYDDSGKEIFSIQKNKWHGPLDAWDMEIVGNRIIIRTEKRRIALDIALNPPNRININHVSMNFEDIFISINDKIVVDRIEHNKKRSTSISNFECDGSYSCMHLMTESYANLNKTKGYVAFADGDRFLIGKGARRAKSGDISIKIEPLNDS